MKYLIVFSFSHEATYAQPPEAKHNTGQSTPPHTRERELKAATGINWYLYLYRP